MSARIPIAVIGASGYTGAELVRLVVGHPRLELVAVCAERSAGARIEQVFPQLAGRLSMELEPFDADRVAGAAEVAFSALPHGQSAAAVASLVERGRMVIDLSADFRLRDPAVYAEWYGEHARPDLMAGAVYGLPELHRAALRGARLIAAPGCYPTAALLASAPLLRRGLLARGSLIVDAKSGVSGAGRTPGLATHFPEVGEGVRPYNVAGRHRHTAEMEQEMSGAAGADVRVCFTPQLVPMSRGILACVYGEASDPSVGPEELRAAMVEAYADEPFVTVVESGLPDTSHVRGTNRAHVAVHMDRRAGRVLAMAAIDNLGKGAAGQAIQCLNVAVGFDEVEGLGGVAAFP
ncbi:MAG TPA: N-acetyl-gamma-glutamyl-phosphate reductase [Kofleriaceae bacterium]|nr:N-acetyl-gamma-glutamyl-phosphate reductase [Kofleriaceae bacterium]